ncbi:MAG: response regulator transcription factor [Bacteroidales bacterium]|nr:response regulator transcription factor [Bacteroidales bacterium]
MINALIIEDEKPAAEHLQKLINSIGFEIHVKGIIGSVKGTADWLNANPHPDLIFMDIQLSDGLSFEIFDYVKITCPVIFTTAYEEYAIKAFKVNSIDYLLKPVSVESLSFSVEKFLSQNRQKINQNSDLFHYQVEQVMQLLTKRFKARFVVNAGVHIKSVIIEKVNCFYSLEKATYLLDNKGRSYDINYILDQLEQLTDPDIFFRINRKYLVNRNTITDIISYSSTKLKIKINHISDDDIFVSRSRTKDFKLWLDM